MYQDYAFKLQPKPLNLLYVRFDLHDGAAGGAPGAPSAGGEGAGVQAETQGPGSSRRANKSGEAAQKVVYGKQPQQDDTVPAAGEIPKTTTATSDTLEARKAEFEKLISGDYKDLFTERTQQIIDRRFKETKGLEAKLADVSPILDMLSQKYELADTDPKKLMEAIEQDERYWEEAAEKAGLSVEQYKTMQKIMRENTELRKANQTVAREQFAQSQMSDWMKQAEQIRTVYPGFDLQTEAANSQFVSLLRNGVDVKTAYEVLHIDDIKASTAQMAGKRTETNITSNIRAKGQRPAEAGIAAPPGVIIKNDVSKLTAADRKEIARCAARGETISF